MARGARPPVVAEGVETAAQVAELSSSDAHRRRAIHLAPPLPAEDAAALLVEQIAPVRATVARPAL